jgi:hypothetical protein
MAANDEVARPGTAAQRHLWFGWWSLALFAAGGLILETLHGFKVGSYLDASNDTRRLMWTLAHAHGALIGVLNVLYGLTLGLESKPVRPSHALMAAGVLLPLGFFLGGLVYYGGDPGFGIVLVPAGAVLLIAALVSIARRAYSRSSMRR